MQEQGSRLELILPSKDDLFLTGNPEITFFKCVYRRHTRFANQIFEVNFDTLADFGTISDLRLPTLGDLLHKIYLKFVIPGVSIDKEISEEEIREVNDELITLKTFQKVFKSLANANLNSYLTITNLFNLNNITLDTLYQIINNNTSDFELKTITVDDKAYNYNIYLSKELQTNKYNHIKVSSGTVSNLFTYGNYQSTLTMTQENIISLLDKYYPDIEEDEVINYVMIILTNIKNTIYNLDKRISDMINETQTKLNKLTNAKYNFAWVKHLGHNIIDYLEIKVGNDVIDKQYGQWINIWNEINGNKYHNDSYDNLIGNVKTLTTYDDNAKPQTILYVPIPFWFCRFVGLSLPLVALNYSDVLFRLKLNEFNSVAISDYPNLNDYYNNTIKRSRQLKCSMICETFFLEEIERRKFARASHEYLIEQTQINRETFILNDSNTFQLNFNHPVKGIVWILQETLNTIYPEIITYSSLSLENDELEDNVNNYYSFVQPNTKFINSGLSGINSYWYCFFPNEQQPSGSCNMSHIKNNKLMFDVDSSYVSKDCTLTCYALNYNILRISNGSGQLAFK